MYNKYLNIVYIVLLVAIIAYLVKYFLNVSSRDGYSNYDLANPGVFPKSVDVPILTGDYQYTGNKYVSNDSYPRIWWHYPIFREGSYEQITNNLRYWKNPDEGTCVRAEFCGALYKDQKNKSNIVLPLPEVKTGPGPRVGYYRTDVNVFPHTTNNFPGLY
jgi:hypothetical protein